MLFRSNREFLPFFVKRMGGKEVHCTFLRANLSANVCAELGHEFNKDIYAEHDVVYNSNTTVFGWCGGRSLLSVHSQCVVLHFNWSEVRYILYIIKLFVISEIFNKGLIAELQMVPKHNVYALRLTIEAKMRSTKFTELFQEISRCGNALVA